MDVSKDLVAASATPLVLAILAPSENGRRRKYYRITKEGRAELASQRNGKLLICPRTPCGRHWSLSSSRNYSTFVERPLGAASGV